MIKLSGPSRKLFTQEKPDKMVIFLHGVGSDGDDLIGLSEDMSSILPEAIFLSPNAPFPYENYPIGYQWFSLSDRSPDKLFKGVKESLPILQNYIDENLAKYQLTYKDLILIGFSQGAMMALQMAPRLAEACFAVIGFSGALVKPDLLKGELKSKPPVCLIHGSADMVVPEIEHKLSVKFFKSMNFSFEDHLIYGLGHSINMKALDFARKFIKGLF